MIIKTYLERLGSRRIPTLIDVVHEDFAEEYDYCSCHYTGGRFFRNEGISLGAVIPQAPYSRLCHPLANETRKRSVRIFHESEQNCNSCKFLERVPFDKQVFITTGLMPGKCLNENRKPVYPQEGNQILFAPDDWMGQECYQSRFEG